MSIRDVIPDGFDPEHSGWRLWCFFSTPDPPPAKPLPQPDDAEGEAAAERARIAAARRLGRRATIVTSGQGVTDPANSRVVSLLGQSGPTA